jgi:hypothetical protein
MGALGIFTFFKNRTSPHVEQGILPAITGNFGDDIAIPFGPLLGASALIERDGREYKSTTGPRRDNQKRSLSGA